jgi:hypothetical protein
MATKVQCQKEKRFAKNYTRCGPLEAGDDFPTFLRDKKAKKKSSVLTPPAKISSFTF